jgi:hypothetical protein
MFPFDHQRLALELSDAKYEARDLRYAEAPEVIGLDGRSRGELASWKLEGAPTYTRFTRVFPYEQGTPRYDYATFSIAVRRHVTFHIIRFFFPLFLIVAVAFSVFWISPDDLSSQVTIGVTCLLAAVALHFAEGSTLPAVEYVTLADRVYASCYLVICIALLESVYTNALVRGDRRNRALRIDRLCRWGLPGALILAIAFSAAIARHRSERARAESAKSGASLSTMTRDGNG